MCCSVLRKQCKDPEWSAASTFDLHRNRENRCAFGRKLFQGSDVFEDRDIACSENLMGQKIPRRTVIDARRVDPHGFDAPLLDQKFRGLFGKAGKMKIANIARLIRAQIALAIAPVPTQPVYIKTMTPLGNLPYRFSHELISFTERR